MTRNIYLLLGSNLSDRERNLLLAIKKINERCGTVITLSSLYQTQPWGISDQPEFLNQVIELESTLSPASLLPLIQNIEKELGRKPGERWGPREIDIDILYFDRQIVSGDSLTIPHAGIAQRRFTLLPLCEIAPSFLHPVLLKSNRQLLAACADTLEVELYVPKSS